MIIMLSCWSFTRWDARSLGQQVMLNDIFGETKFPNAQVHVVSGIIEYPRPVTWLAHSSIIISGRGNDTD